MSERQTGPYDSIARRWLALVERRQQHLIELCDSGRWRHYYTQTEFLAEMRKVLQLRDQWAAIAGLPLSDEMLEDDLQDDEGVLTDRKFRAPRPTERRREMPAAAWPD